MLEQRNYYEAKIDRIEAANDARERIARHESNNVKMWFRALRLPNPPEMRVAILAYIEPMEADQSAAEAAEKGA